MKRDVVGMVPPTLLRPRGPIHFSQRRVESRILLDPVRGEESLLRKGDDTGIGEARQA